MNIHNPQSGQIWRLVPEPPDDNEPQLVLVVGPSHPGLVQVVPVHPYLEYACQYDLVVPPAVSGLTYGLVVVSTMRCTAETRLLDYHVGTLPYPLNPNGQQDGAGLDDGVHRGAALRGPLDARAEFRRLLVATLPRWQCVP